MCLKQKSDKATNCSASVPIQAFSSKCSVFKPQCKVFASLIYSQCPFKLCSYGYTFGRQPCSYIFLLLPSLWSWSSERSQVSGLNDVNCNKTRRCFSCHLPPSQRSSNRTTFREIQLQIQIHYSRATFRPHRGRSCPPQTGTMFREIHCISFESYTVRVICF